MKNILKSLLVVAVLLSSVSLFAQNTKFGHINVNELISLMPERDNAQGALQTYAQELESELGIMQKEFEAKYTEYLQAESTLNDVIKASKQEELQSMQVRIQEYQQNAEQSYAKKEAELLQPILDKANEAIQQVGKENGYTYIFDASSGVVVFISENSNDVLPLVKTKLGIVDKAE
jgi:outer membrane protein